MTNKQHWYKKWWIWLIVIVIIIALVIIPLIIRSSIYCYEFSGSGSYAWGGGYECRKAGCKMIIYNERSGGSNCWDCDSFDFICY